MSSQPLVHHHKPNLFGVAWNDYYAQIASIKGSVLTVASAVMMFNAESMDEECDFFKKIAFWVGSGGLGLCILNGLIGGTILHCKLKKMDHPGEIKIRKSSVHNLICLTVLGVAGAIVAFTKYALLDCPSSDDDDGFSFTTTAPYQTHSLA